MRDESLQLEIKLYGILGGVINSAIIGITNYFYEISAGPLVTAENHKY